VPRSSTAAKAVPAPVTKMPLRPSPPDYLPADAQFIWRIVTGARPADYFDAASLGLLEGYARSLAEHRRIMATVEGMDPAADVATFAKLTRLADAHAARVSQLATRMRLSHQARTDSRKAARDTGDHRSQADRIRSAYRGNA
jgi:phage terminase small subunit